MNGLIALLCRFKEALHSEDLKLYVEVWAIRIRLKTNIMKKKISMSFCISTLPKLNMIFNPNDFFLTYTCCLYIFFDMRILFCSYV